MSAAEIIAELPKLTREELGKVHTKIEELMPREPNAKISVWEVFQQFSGTVEGLPPDFAENHDKYLYGTPSEKK